ncbi:DUF421 domain-containing protein [Cohnella rhizosphaerae]|uniref:DUF421 domain-containing protein n=1 Tax=Cohnella rhizosphaerae TaxID=1457232 RepID=A0A9X4L066_9BACL|nr:YetF domain-containing protein [Cohnella rhizosphaerae]MDG0811102.1 DUF421 domain-containing protein [Cohnella rhizosphaerae]
MFTVFWQSLVLAFAGILLLRLSGRKSIAEMTIPQVGVLLTLGTILGSDVAGKGLPESLLAVFTFLAVLYLSEWISLKWNPAERALKGAAVPIIKDGNLLTDNMKKLRLSVDDMEKRLRLAGIASIQDIRFGTIETNGAFGYELMPHARPLTRRDLEEILKANFPQIVVPPSAPQADIFAETLNPLDQPPAPKKIALTFTLHCKRIMRTNITISILK